MTSSRFPRWVFAEGDEPDPRFTLANERTFLAWIRTALALVAGGVALEALAVPIQPACRACAATLLLVLGGGLPLVAWRDWAVTERALRRRRPLPASLVTLPLAVGVFATAALVLVGYLLR